MEAAPLGAHGDAVTGVRGALQVFHNNGEDTSYLEYSNDGDDVSVSALAHDMTTLETRGKWCRFWCVLNSARLRWAMHSRLRNRQLPLAPCS